MNTSVRFVCHMTFKTFKVDIILLKDYIVVTDVVNDVTDSRKSVNTRVVITLFIIWQVMKYREICIKYNQYLKKLYFHM